MDAKQKQSIRESVEFVEANYPPGTMLRYRENNELFMIGTRSRNSFWMMSTTRGEKGLVEAVTITDKFKLENPTFVYNG
jgi:hypothetical protein